MRSRFHPPAWTRVPPLISGDGTRLVVPGVAKPPSSSPNSCWGGTCVKPVWPFERRGPMPGQDPRERLRWYVVDTADGRLVAAPPVTAVAAAGPWLDPTGRRLYILSSSADPPGSDVGAATLVGYDLASGGEVGRVVLPEITLGLHRAGSRWTDDLPGVALSPDGHRLAVVHPDLSAVTLIDAERLEVERVVAVHRRVGLAGRVLGWLGLAPSAAAAKGTPGTTVSAVFGPDGRRLYVSGFAFTDFEQGQTLGLRAIDVASGEIVAEAEALATDAEPLAVRPAPDGRSVYAERITDGGAFALLRLDAATLDLAAQRLFPGDRQVVLVSRERSGRV